MYVKVTYQQKTNGQMFYSGREYTYKTDLPLKRLDKVIAPTYKGDSPALVTAINVPETEINPDWADKIRTITQYDTEETENA